MLMNVLASGFLFLFIGPFKHVSSGKTKETGQVKLQQDVYIAVHNTLQLNCYISRTIQSQLAWKHDNKWIHNFTTHIVNNNTRLQLRKKNTGYEDAGVYKCGFFNNSKFHSTQSIRVLVGEKPLVASVNQIYVKVYGSPVQKVHLEWPAQANVTNGVFVGRIPAGSYPPCKFRNASDCKQTAVLDHKNLSCQIGMDVLGKLFQWNELNGECSTNKTRCDTFCVKIIARNAFGTSESVPALTNLKHAAVCPALRNLRVSLNGDNITVSWKRPYLVQENVSYNYDVTYVVTPILTGQPSPPKSVDGSTTNCNECVSIKPIVPYARYSFAATCNFYDNKEAGPAAYAEVMSKEAAPSEVPYSCEVKNRSRHDAFLSWKIPAINTWNGIPRKFLVQYENHIVAVNISLDELQARDNRSTATPAAGTVLTNLDPHKNYSVMVAMCSGGGCRNFSKSCRIIPVTFTEDDYSEKVPVSPDTTNNTGVATWIAIAFGLITGISLAVFIGYLIWRKRTRRKQQPPLISVLGPLDGPHPYENDSDDRPSFIEEDQNYDTISAICRPLLNNMDCTVGNFPVTNI